MNVTENTMVLSITYPTFVGSNSHMEQLAERLTKSPWSASIKGFVTATCGKRWPPSTR